MTFWKDIVDYIETQKFSPMKLSFLIYLAVLGIFSQSCNSQNKEQTNKSLNQSSGSEAMVIDGQTYKPYQGKTGEKSSTSNSGNVRIKYFDIKDTRNGLSSGSVPMPENFEMHTTGKYAFTGPNGIKLSGSRGSYFAFSDNPQENYNYQAMGLEVKYPETIDEIINRTFLAHAKTINRKLIKTYPLPGVTNFYQQFNRLLYKPNTAPQQYESRGLDWEDPDGTSFQTILTVYHDVGSNAHFWGYYYQVIESPKAYFEEAKKIHVNSITNQDVNMNWVQTMNNQSKATLDADKRQWEEWRATNKYVNDQFQASQAKRREVNDGLNEQYNDYLTDKTTTVDPNTGQERKPDAGSTYYWYNENGEYISTDKSYYNPNTDPAVNQNHTWTLNSKKY